MTLIQRDREILPGHDRRVRRWVMQELGDRQIQVHCNERAIGIEGAVAEAWLNTSATPPPTGAPTAPQPAGILRCASGLGIPCDRVVWVTQAMAPPWLAASGLATDAGGFIQVDETLRSRSHPFVFAAGDIAALPDPRPKAGVFAVRQGKPLFENLRAVLGDRPLRPYRPQRQYLNLIGTGDGRAIASRGWLTARGAGLWTWKDHIDRQFMQRFAALPPAMSPPISRRSQFPAFFNFPESLKFPAFLNSSTFLKSPAPSPSSQREPSTAGPPRHNPEPPMYCGGCGSKVGRSTLDQVLQRLRAERRLPSNTDPTILVGLDRPDDAAVVLPTGDRPLVQTLDHFRALLADPYTFGQIAAHHCLSDLYAMGATPHSALALATVPYGSPAAQAETLYQLLAGILTVLDQVGATLIGGHTTEGPEIALGLSCNGWGSRSDHDWSAPEQTQTLTCQPGDALILTQALGTGTLFAAGGANQARGDWIDGAIAAMTHSNQDAAQILADHGAIACTDVTGFGLAGHLLDLLRSHHCGRRVGVDLDLASLPVLDGAIATLRQGWFSSLHARNAEADRHMRYGGDRPETRWQDPRWQLLFDPQTSGGLLAVVPGDQAVACCDRLRAQGYGDAGQIGVVRSQLPDFPQSICTI